jgi:RND family efflux transporter MFP subunit
VANAGGAVLLVDATSGETWVLNAGKEPTWVAVPKAAPAARPAAKDAMPKTPEVAPPKTPEVAPAKSGVEVIARIVPARSSQIAAPSAGVVARVLVREGDAVKAGQILVELNDTEAKLGVDAARAELVRAKAALEHTLAAFKTNTVSAGERNRAEAECRVAEARLGMAEVKLQATRVLAPFDGTVVTLGVAPGEAVGTGAAPVAVVSDLKDLHAALLVSEEDAGKVAVGRPCKVRMQVGDAEYDAVVVSVAAVVDDRGTVAARARLKLPEGVTAPRPGSSATARFDAK